MVIIKIKHTIYGALLCIFMPRYCWKRVFDLDKMCYLKRVEFPHIFVDVNNRLHYITFEHIGSYFRFD